MIVSWPAVDLLAGAPAKNVLSGVMFGPMCPFRTHPLPIGRMIMSHESNEQSDVEQADVVALLEAHQRGDEPTINYLVDQVGVYPMFAATVGFLVEVIGRDRLDEVLTEWRRAQGQ